MLSMMRQDMKLAAKNTLVLSGHHYYFEFEDDLDYFYQKLYSQLPWFRELDDARQLALVNLCYDLGWKKVMEMTQLMDALKKEEFQIAAYILFYYDYPKNIINRKKYILEMIDYGVIPKLN